MQRDRTLKGHDAVIPAQYFFISHHSFPVHANFGKALFLLFIFFVRIDLLSQKLNATGLTWKARMAYIQQCTFNTRLLEKMKKFKLELKLCFVFSISQIFPCPSVYQFQMLRF